MIRPPAICSSPALRMTGGEATRAAKDLAVQGFTVVVYDHGHVTALPGASDYRQVAKFWPDGRVEP